MAFWGIFQQEFYKNIVIFEINTLKLVNFQNFAKSQKMSKFKTKNAFLRYF